MMRIAKSLILFSLTCMACTSAFGQDAAVDEEETKDRRLGGVIIQVPHDLPASVMAELTEVLEEQEEKIPFRIKTIDGRNAIVIRGQRDAVLEAAEFADELTEAFESGDHEPQMPTPAVGPGPRPIRPPSPGEPGIHIAIQHLKHHLPHDVVHKLALEHRALTKSGKDEEAEEIEQKIREHLREHVKHQLEAQWKHVDALENRLEKLRDRLNEKEEHFEHTIDREIEGLLNHFSHLKADVDLDLAVEIREGMIWHEAQADRWLTILQEEKERARRAERASSAETAWEPSTGARPVKARAAEGNAIAESRLAEAAKRIEQLTGRKAQIVIAEGIAIAESRLAEAAKRIEQLAGRERARIVTAESAAESNEIRLLQAIMEYERIEEGLKAAKKAFFEAQVESERESNGELP